MKYIKTKIPGIVLIEPNILGDDRGYFFESFRQNEFDSKVGQTNFVQENESKSSFGVLRGLHYQSGSQSQAKLIRVIKGKVLDVAVDLRLNSETFGQHLAIEISDKNKRQLFIPRGFAHGFLTLSEYAVLSYKCDNYYHKESEVCILYKDFDLNINWQLSEDQIQVSDKDQKGLSFKNASYFD